MAKYTYYTTGIVTLTLGVTFTIQSNLGVSPFDALLVGLAANLGLTVGSWEVIIAFILIGCNSMLKKQKPEFSGLLTALVTGISIDVWLFLLDAFVTPELWVTKLLCFSIGLLTIGMGTAIYLCADFAPIPVDRFMLIIRELTKMNIGLTKTIIYILFLSLSLLFQGPVGVGTILAVCLGGPILHYCMALTDFKLKPPSSKQAGI
ncbi:YitT family protein [Domibacillus sp. 8LH]|uniref:YczE/YyaS/YitT family protein n=1 Tax=Domibacillus sp. 8LH TaxID=3073900 RepID=UPI00317E7739